MEPQIEIVEKIVRERLGIGNDEDGLSVEFFAEGAFNKLYKAQCPKESYVMRVSLPVDPGHKTLSETTTLAFVRANTDIPVPKVIAFDASFDNEFGFEWILTELMPGQPYQGKWKTLPWAAKERMVKRLAHYSAQLFRLKFSGIGNIYRKADPTSSEEQPTVDNNGCIAKEDIAKETIIKELVSYFTQLFRSTFPGISNAYAKEGRPPSAEEYTVGRISSIPFFYKNRVNYDVPRGPFASDRDWLTAHLAVTRLESEAVLSNPPEGDPNDKYAGCDLEEAGLAKSLVDRLSLRLHWLFPRTDPTNGAETTVLFHDDINENNILVDDDGNVTALVDWECVSALPEWRACQFPRLLEGNTNDEKPNAGEYAELIEENLQLLGEPQRVRADSTVPCVLGRDGEAGASVGRYLSEVSDRAGLRVRYLVYFQWMVLRAHQRMAG